MATEIPERDESGDEGVCEGERAEPIEAEAPAETPHPLADILAPVTVEDMLGVLETLNITTSASFEARFGEVQRKIVAMVTRRMLAARQCLKENER